MSRPAYEELAHHLRHQILVGELMPGDRLPTEPELSARHGVSRSTVREALRVLSSQNLVETTRGVAGGSFVVHPRAEHVRDYLEVSLGLLAVADEVGVESLLEVRDLLEIPAAGLAAERAGADEIAALRATLVDPRSTEPGEMHRCNHRFHALIVAAAGNSLLEVVAGPVYRTLTTRFARGEADVGFWDEVIDDHRAIVEAVEARDGAAARELSAAHLDRLRGTYVAIDRASRAERAGDEAGARAADAELDRLTASRRGRPAS